MVCRFEVGVGVRGTCWGLTWWMDSASHTFPEYQTLDLKINLVTWKKYKVSFFQFGLTFKPFFTLTNCEFNNVEKSIGLAWFVVFYATFNNISVISWQSVLLVGETGGYHRPVASHWQALSHNVVSNTPRHERGSNSEL